MLFTFLPCFQHLLLLLLLLLILLLVEEAYLGNRKINEVESLNVEMYQYVLGNRGIMLTLVVHVLLIVLSPSNVL